MNDNASHQRFGPGAAGHRHATTCAVRQCRHRRIRPAMALALSAALLSATTQSDASGLLIADGGLGGVLEIRDHDVRVVINNGIAVTTVNQVFLNTENRVVEALYTFPVPKDASVANFSMWINGREMIGEVVEKERAREIYDSYKRVGRDPGLLEQVDYRSFEMRIFPIAAGAEQRVSVTYYQELDVDHDWATYIYPLATDTRRDIDQRATGRFSCQIDVRSEVPVIQMESPSHAAGFSIAEFNSGYWQASLETAEGDLSRDVILAYHLSRPRTGMDMIASRQAGEDGFLALALTVGEELSRFDVGMDYVFILDVSGSMAGDGKLQLSTDGVAAFIDALGPDDRFDIMTFNNRAAALFNKLTPVADDSQARAAEFLMTREARGGTLLRPALEAAYQYGDPDRPLNIVIFSDGMTEQAERSTLLQMSARTPANHRVFCIGIGNDIDRPMLSQLAEEAGGLAAFLSRGDDFARQAAAFRRKLTRPAATGVQIRFAGDSVFDVEPAILPNLYHGAPLRLYARYRQAGPVNVTLSADVMGRPLSQTVTIDLPEAEDANPQIERMWAWHRVQRLLRDADRIGTRSSAIDEIVDLGERFSIATEYTSFIVLENDAEYTRWKIDRRNTDRFARDRRSHDKLLAELEGMRARIASDLGPASPIAAKKTAARPAPVSGAQPTRPQSPGASTPSRGWDLDLPGVGGGAIDPVTGLIVIGLVGGALVGRRRRIDMTHGH